jgi:uncharacterized protein YkwD
MWAATSVRRCSLAKRAALCAVVAVAVLALAGCTPEPDPGDPYDTSSYARQLFDLSNEERAEQGEPPLQWSDCLAQKAAPRAENIVPTLELQHELLTEDCHGGDLLGENLSRADYTPQEVVDAWMGSPAHRANIVNEAFVASGISCVQFIASGPVEPDTPDDLGQGMACSQLFENAAP